MFTFMLVSVHLCLRACLCECMQLTSEATADRKHYHSNPPLTVKTWHLVATWAAAAHCVLPAVTHVLPQWTWATVSAHTPPNHYEVRTCASCKVLYVIVQLLLIKHLIWIQSRFLAETKEVGVLCTGSVLCPSSVYCFVSFETVLMYFSVYWAPPTNLYCSSFHMVELQGW